MVRKRAVDAHESSDPKFKHWKSRFKSAAISLDRGDVKEARTLLFRSQYEAAGLRSDDREFANNACNLGIAVVAMAEGNMKESKEYFDKGLSKTKSKADSAHEELYATGLRFLALWHEKNDDLKETESCLQESVKILEGLGEDSAVQLAHSLTDLCYVFVRSGRVEEASAYIKPALEILLVTVGEEDPELDWAKMIYRASLTKRDEEQFCDEFEHSAIKLQYKVGANHPILVRALNAYASALKQRGWTERLDHLKEGFSAVGSSK